MTDDNLYTAKPKPWQGWLAGSLQLVFWLAFSPSAWANHLRSIDVGLLPDFCLLDLSRAQWKDPALRRLIVQFCLVLPLIILMIFMPAYYFLYGSGGSIPFEVWSIPGYVLASSLVLAAGVSLPAGLVFGSVMAIGILFISPLEHNITGVLAAAAAMTGRVQVILAPRAGPGLTPRRIGGVLLSVLGPIAVLVAGYFLITRGVQPAQDTASFGTDLPENFVLWVGSGIALLVSVFSAVAFYQRTNAWTRGLIVFSLALGLTAGLTLSVGLVTSFSQLELYFAAGFGGGVLFPFIFSLGYYMAYRFGGAAAGGIVGAFTGGLGWVPLAPVIFSPPIDIRPSMIQGLIFLLVGLTFHLIRQVLEYPLLLLWANILYYVDHERPAGRTSLRLHPAFWNEYQHLPWAGLDSHLVMLAERNPEEAERAFQRLAPGRQAWAARSAQIELAARQIGKCRDLQSIAGVHQSLASGLLPGPASPIIQQFSEISQDVKTALQQTSELHSRTLLGEIRSRLHRLNNDLMISSLRYAQRFVPITDHWLRIVTHHLDQAAFAVQASENLPNPYIYNTPLVANQAVFVGRADILTRIEQSMLEPSYAPLLIYGQRRTGKTSLLLNLGRILPSSIIPAYVDFQASVSANDYADLYYNLIQQIQRSTARQRGVELPAVDLGMMLERPFLCFNDWLNAVETYLEKNEKILLVKLDEIETLNQVFTRPLLPPEVFFNSLRNTIQHRPRFRFVLAGSHTLAELQHWSNYLINSQLIKIGYLEPAEARQLIERPAADFQLRYQPQAVQLILDLTRAHPYLVQMVCHELVMLKNTQPVGARYLTAPADVEAAAARALETGGFFFTDLISRVPEPAAAMLRHLAGLGQGACLPATDWRAAFPDDFDAQVVALLQRDIIETTSRGYRFQVELVRRFLEG